MKKLYNEDGTLSSEAEFLITPKPEHINKKNWNKLLKSFKELLTTEECKEFQRLKGNARAKKYRLNHLEKVQQRNALNYDREYGKEWRAKHPGKIKEYSKTRYHNNKEELLAASKNWHKQNPQKSRINHQRWIENNPESVLRARAKASLKHREYNNNYSNNWQKQRRKTDPIYRLMSCMRVRCHQIVKQLAMGKKPASTIEMCGCSVEELKTHLESLFVEGMSWENYGEWVVDHIRPVCSFSAEEWQQVNHYSNLQPLWSYDNSKKSLTDKQLSRSKNNC